MKTFPYSPELQEFRVAYYRLPKELKEFFDICLKDHKIVGFEWDEEDPWNFGVILSELEGVQQKSSDQESKKD